MIVVAVKVRFQILVSHLLENTAVFTGIFVTVCLMAVSFYLKARRSMRTAVNLIIFVFLMITTAACGSFPVASRPTSVGESGRALFEGELSADGAEYRVRLSWVGAEFSTYEVEKSGGRYRDAGVLSGILTLDKKEKRGVGSDCKYLEEHHFVLQGRRGKAGFIAYATELDDLDMPARLVTIRGGDGSLESHDLQVQISSHRFFPARVETFQVLLKRK
jgi:hypothetical protein